MNKIFLYLVNDKTYEVEVTYKRIRNIHYRFDGEKFLVSSPRLVSLSKIKSGLDKYAQRLIDTNVKNKAESLDYIYILGQKYDLSYPGEIVLPDATEISFKDIEQMKRKLKKWFLSLMSERVSLYEKEMGAPHYNVKVRMMKSRYGSNNKHTQTLTFSFVLVHYSLEIIDSVIVHELAHCFVYDHSDKFYKVVYKYCPNYDRLRKKLIKVELS